MVSICAATWRPRDMSAASWRTRNLAGVQADLLPGALHVNRLTARTAFWPAAVRRGDRPGHRVSAGNNTRAPATRHRRQAHLAVINSKRTAVTAAAGIDGHLPAQTHRHDRADRPAREGRQYPAAASRQVRRLIAAPPSASSGARRPGRGARCPPRPARGTAPVNRHPAGEPGGCLVRRYDCACDPEPCRPRRPRTARTHPRR